MRKFAWMDNHQIKILYTSFSIFMKRIGRTRDCFVWSDTVQTFHEDISQNNRINSLHCKRESDLESRVALKAAQIQGNDRNVRVAGFLSARRIKPI